MNDVEQTSENGFEVSPCLSTIHKLNTHEREVVLGEILEGSFHLHIKIFHIERIIL
jgi:hypothetical protein